MKILTTRLFEILPSPFGFLNEECLRLEEGAEGSVLWEPDIFAEFATLAMGLGFCWATAGMSYSNVRFEFEQTEIGSYTITIAIRIEIDSAPGGKILLMCWVCNTLECLAFLVLKLSLPTFFSRCLGGSF
jgi:hypothetical protein